MVEIFCQILFFFWGGGGYSSFDYLTFESSTEKIYLTYSETLEAGDID